MWAISNEDIEITKFLINTGANPNIRDNNGWTALMRATQWIESTEALKLLIEVGANVNAKSNHGKTALMNSAWVGNTKGIKVLIKAGADVNAKDEDGHTALIWAHSSNMGRQQYRGNKGSPRS